MTDVTLLQKGAKFSLGQLVVTPAVTAALDDSDLTSALLRHSRGDWGEVSDEDWTLNEASLRGDYRLCSAYRGRNGMRFWIVTEADRSATTVQFPHEA